MRRWVVLHEGGAQACQRVILTVIEDRALDPLKLDTYRMVIAVATAQVIRNTRVPRALITTDKAGRSQAVSRRDRICGARPGRKPSQTKPSGVTDLRRTRQYSALVERAGDAATHGG